MNLIPITQAVKIKKKRVSSFKGEKGYLSTGDLNVNVIKKLVPITYENRPSRADLILDTGDLIVARMQATQKVILISENEADMIVSTGFLTLEPKKGWDGEFLYFYLNSPFFQEQKDRLCTGATQKAINNTKFKEITIPEISLENQLKIVEQLRTLDSLLKKRRESLLLMDDYLKSVFLEMFGDPVLNTKGWKTEKFDSLCERLSDGPFGSKLKTEHYSENGVRVVRLQNIGVGKFKNKDKSYIREDHYQKELSRYTCIAGDIVIATLGDPNIRACIVPKNIHKAVHKADCVHCVPKQKLNKQYIVSLLNLPRFHHFFAKHIHGQTRSRVSSGQLKKVLIPLPPIEEQKKYSEIYNLVNSLKTKMKSQSQGLETSFKAMMQDAFTTNE